MARVTIETVDHVARLAHLSLSPEERETFARQLDEVLERFTLGNPYRCHPAQQLRADGEARE